MGVPSLNAKDIPCAIMDDYIVQGMIAAWGHTGQVLLEYQIIGIVDLTFQNAMIDGKIFVVDVFLLSDLMEFVDIGARTSNGEEMAYFRFGGRRAKLQRGISLPRAAAGEQGKGKSQHASPNLPHRRHP